MTSFPTIASYELAVHHMNKFVFAPQFEGGSPIYNKDRIIGYSGSYSVVYPIIVNGKKLAIRCWIKNPGNIQERYIKVKEYLQSHQTSYFVDFEYIEKGILVDGKIYPVSCMEWVEGKVLSQFIDENINDVTIIKTLADRFLAMVKELHRNAISHGNLKDSDIIVVQNSSNFDLKLIDYDCLYTPTLLGLNYQNDVQGISGYQHPQRYKQSNEKADYFSELVIYLSLLVYAEQPLLWIPAQERRMLFELSDFINPSNSVTFRMLETLSSKVKTLSHALRKFCEEKDTNRLLPLEQILKDNAVSEDKSIKNKSPHVVTSSSRKLNIFLCHSSNDKPQVRKLYKRLKSDKFDPWLDEEKLLPGQDWRYEIPKAVHNADVVIVCLSRSSINKAGYVQKEITHALDVADEQPEGTIFLIPLKLEECQVPDRLSKWQWVNYFEKNGYKRLLGALQVRVQENDIALIENKEKKK